MKIACLLLFILASIGSWADLNDSPIVSYPVDQEINSLPDNCLFSGAQTCLVQSRFHRKLPIKKESYEITLGSASSVWFKDAGSPVFLKGELWLKGDMVLETEFGAIVCQACEAFVLRNEKEVRVRAMAGKILFRSVGKDNTKKDLHIPNYSENWMAGVDVKTGISRTGIPQPIEIKKHIRKWGQFYSGDKAEFKAAIDRFHRSWVYTVHDFSEEFHKMSNRRIASVTDKRRVKQQRKKQKREADKVFRDMLRQRALFE